MLMPLLFVFIGPPQNDTPNDTPGPAQYKVGRTACTPPTRAGAFVVIFLAAADHREPSDQPKTKKGGHLEACSIHRPFRRAPGCRVRRRQDFARSERRGADL